MFRLDSVDEREQAFHVLDKLRGKLAERNVREIVHDLPGNPESREANSSLLQLCLHVSPDLHIFCERLVAQTILADLSRIGIVYKSEIEAGGQKVLRS